MRLWILPRTGGEPGEPRHVHADASCSRRAPGGAASGWLEAVGPCPPTSGVTTGGGLAAGCPLSH
eukprot:3193606-Pyramimonas_sp.AAC.1